jgi:hypothetical protein
MPAAHPYETGYQSDLDGHASRAHEIEHGPAFDDVMGHDTIQHSTWLPQDSFLTGKA